MATADGTRLIARLQAAIKIAEESPIVLADVALDTIADVKASAAARLTGQEYQVGFDLDQFQENISRPSRLHVPAPGVGIIGILDVEEMGTAEDFEAIGSIPGLFHQHTGDTHGTWRNIVYPDPALRDEVARERQAIWGNRTPQWLLLEEGFTGNGAFPSTPPHHFIQDATRANTVLPRMRAAFARLFRGL